MSTNKINNDSKFKSIFNSLNDGISIFSFDGELLEANDRILERFGLTREALNAHSAKLPTNVLKTIPKIIKQNINKEEFMLEIFHTDPFGKRYPVEIKAKRIEYLGKPAFLAVSRDITLRKQLQNEILKAVIKAEEDERSRVAKELHDGISPILSTAKLYAQSLKDTNNEEMQQTLLEKVEQTINDSIQSIVEISNNLSPHVLQNFGTETALQSFIDKNSALRQICINLNCKIHKRFDPIMETTIYRIMIELMNNTFKHACATEINIEIDKKGEESIRLQYSDNGKGFDFKEEIAPSMGMGLYNIKHRIDSLNGNSKICTSPNSGFTFIATLPINETVREELRTLQD